MRQLPCAAKPTTYSIDFTRLERAMAAITKAIGRNFHIVLVLSAVTAVLLVVGFGIG